MIVRRRRRKRRRRKKLLLLHTTDQSLSLVWSEQLEWSGVQCYSITMQQCCELVVVVTLLLCVIIFLLFFFPRSYPIGYVCKDQHYYHTTTPRNARYHFISHIVASELTLASLNKFSLLKTPFPNAISNNNECLSLS